MAEPPAPPGEREPTAGDEPGQIASTDPGAGAVAYVDPGAARSAMDRGKFLSGATVGVGGLMGAVIAVPALGVGLAPAFKTEHVLRRRPRPDEPVPSRHVPGPVPRRHVRPRTPRTRRASTAASSSSATTATTSSPRSRTRACTSAARSATSAPASPARATAASTTPRAAARPARPCARSTATRTSVDSKGHLILGQALRDGRQPAPAPAQGAGPARDRRPLVPLSRPPRRARSTARCLRTRPTARELVVDAPLEWVEERSGFVGLVETFLFRNVPEDTSWLQTLGSSLLIVFVLQATTGVILAMIYDPSPAGGLRLDPLHHGHGHARLAGPRHAQVGLERHGDPALPAHGARRSSSAPTSTRAS